MTSLPLFVGLDVGGTTMKAGVVDDQGKPLSTVSLPTEAYKGQEHGLERMCETIRQAVRAAELRMEQVAAIGVATPGTMDIPAGMILDPPNLRPWQNMPVRQHVHDTFQVPTAFQNDANAAAHGAFWAGAGDELADKIVEETAYYLAVGATNMMHTIDPDMVVFGGGMIAAGEGFLDRIRRHIRQLAFPVPAAKTQIRYAQLGTDAGFIG